MIRINISSKVKKLREDNKLTQKDLAIKLNITPQVISNIERGYTTSVDPETLARLADIFGVDTDYLLGRKYTGTIVREEVKGEKDLLDLLNKEGIKKLKLTESYSYDELKHVIEMLDKIKGIDKNKRESN